MNEKCGRLAEKGCTPLIKALKVRAVLTPSTKLCVDICISLVYYVFVVKELNARLAERIRQRSHKPYQVGSTPTPCTIFKARAITGPNKNQGQS